MVRRRGFNRLTACVLSVIIGGSAILAGSASYASASSVNAAPGIICCGYVNISTVSIVVSSSNLDSNNTVTITFTTSPSGTTNSVSWGLSTSYSGYESGSVSLGTSTRLVLPYMNPGEKFYFSIIASYHQTGVEWYNGEWVSSFSTPAVPHPQSGLISTNSTSWEGSGPVYGYAVNQSGNRLSGASIEANYTSQEGSCGTEVQLTLPVAANGSYVIPVWVSTTSFVNFCTLQSWQASDAGHMLENWTLPSSEQRGELDNGAQNWQTFYLTSQFTTSASQLNSAGGQDGVYNAIAYVHTVNATCQVQEGVIVDTSVLAYLAGN